MRFFPEHVMFSILKVTLVKLRQDFMIMALEPTTVTCISQNEMERLCSKPLRENTIQKINLNSITEHDENDVSMLLKTMQQNATIFCSRKQ